MGDLRPGTGAGQLRQSRRLDRAGRLRAGQQLPRNGPHRAAARASRRAWPLPSRPLPAPRRDGEQRVDRSTAAAANIAEGGPTLMVALLLGAGLFVVCFSISLFILR